MICFREEWIDMSEEGRVSPMRNSIALLLASIYNM